MSSADDTIQRDPGVSDSEATLWVLLTSAVDRKSMNPICNAMRVSMSRSNIRGGFTPHDVTLFRDATASPERSRLHHSTKINT